MTSDAFASIIVFLVVSSAFLAWLTHIIVCLGDGLWGFLIAGALIFPIAVIHGYGIWLGVF